MIILESYLLDTKLLGLIMLHQHHNWTTTIKLHVLLFCKEKLYSSFGILSCSIILVDVWHFKLLKICYINRCNWENSILKVCMLNEANRVNLNVFIWCHNPSFVFLVAHHQRYTTWEKYWSTMIAEPVHVDHVLYYQPCKLTIIHLRKTL